MDDAVLPALARIIVESGMPLRQLQRRTGIDVGALSRISQGRVDPKLSTAAVILKAVGRTWADLGEPDLGKLGSPRRQPIQRPASPTTRPDSQTGIDRPPVAKRRRTGDHS